MSSVLRDWVMVLPLREQGTLVVALRGCDVAPKLPLDSPERRITAAIRYAVMNPADEREVDSEPGAFMTRAVPLDVKLSMFEHYPQHWIGHILHAVQVLGFRHPDPSVRLDWLKLYVRFTKALHLRIEPREAMIKRLSEDRIAAGNVVSL